MSKKISFDLSDFQNLNESDEIEVVEESMKDNECKAPEMYKSQYEKIMKSLKQSFKESVEIIEMLEKAKIKDDEEKEKKDDEDIEESVDIMDEELFESEGLDLSAFDDVDSFSEAVSKREVAKAIEIKEKLFKKLKKEIKTSKYIFIPFNNFKKSISTLNGNVNSTGLISGNLITVTKKEDREDMVDVTSKKQIIGFVYISPDDIKEFADGLTEKFKDELEDLFIDNRQVTKEFGEVFIRRLFKKYDKSYKPYALFVNK